MSDNLQVKDGIGDLQTMRTKDVSPNPEQPIHVAASTPMDQTGEALFTPQNPGVFAGLATIASYSMQRPANTVPYAIGALVGNDLSAVQVIPFQFPVGRAAGTLVEASRARLFKTSTSTLNAIFRLHLHQQYPDILAGDGQPWLTNTAGYFGSFTFDMTNPQLARVFSDGAKIIAAPDVGANMISETADEATVVYGILQVLAGYTPASGEIFTIEIEATAP
jgi:hypothetical protein